LTPPGGRLRLTFDDCHSLIRFCLRAVERFCSGDVVRAWIALFLV
jgi:hypothetical protein